MARHNAAMYQPPQFRSEDPALAAELIRAYDVPQVVMSTEFDDHAPENPSNELLLEAIREDELAARLQREFAADDVEPKGQGRCAPHGPIRGRSGPR